MSVFFIALAFVLVAAPVLTSEMFRSAWHSERRQIAVDNAGITLGQHERDLFRDLQAHNRHMKTAEQAHHLVHLCARTPSPEMEGCIAADEKIEQTLKAWHSLARAKAVMAWLRAGRAAKATAEELENQIGLLYRNPLPPLEAGKCSICGLESYWEISEDDLPMQTRIEAVRETPEGERPFVWVRSVGKSLRESDWDYRLSVKAASRK